MISSIKFTPENINFSNNSTSAIKQDDTKAIAVALFKQKNATDGLLENKVMFFQRHIRAKFRKDSEIQRISQLGLKPEEVFSEADTPYRPQECSSTLANRIMEAAEGITLYNTIQHLAAIENIDKILDGCLYGRENLTRLNLPFRKAALTFHDVNQGDGNVICFGPHLIDPICIKKRTMAIELDLKKIVDPNHFSRNPSIFFKQKDLMYNPRKTSQPFEIKIKDESFQIGLYSIYDGNELKLVIIDGNGNSQSSPEIMSCKFISYNINEMHKILVLNFFKFLDGLPNKQLTHHIYGKINDLNNEELILFLNQLGNKMSFACEFNFYGAYKIDLNALVYFHFYDDYPKIYDDYAKRTSSMLDKELDISIEIKTLVEELNNGSYESFNKIKKWAPELLKSSRFMQFLHSKISDSQLATQFINISKMY